MQETQVQSLGGEDPHEEEMATHSSILAWEIPWTEKPGRPQSMRVTKNRTWLSSAQQQQYPASSTRWQRLKIMKTKKMKRSSQEIKYSNMSNIWFKKILRIKGHDFVHGKNLLMNENRVINLTIKQDISIIKFRNTGDKVTFYELWWVSNDKKGSIQKTDKTLNVKYIDYRNIFIWLIYNINIIYIYTSKIRNKNGSGNGFL